ncbi:uncharacterized protein TNCV_1697011 [Trichonephila clavipes]|nr:uncharacterized protein TNCV_1697011 [Trichonephila clavipes]
MATIPSILREYQQYRDTKAYSCRFSEVIEIHGFADASERCYGAAVYCKSKNLKSETLVQLITSKSRVAPIKSLTIPRLELCAAVLLAKLVKRVVAALQLETAEVYLWSDSMIVLAWLRKEPMDLKTFVQNRVAKIQELYLISYGDTYHLIKIPQTLSPEESI